MSSRVRTSNERAAGDHDGDDQFPEDADTPTQPDDTRPLIGRVAVVGYPNVGKSTLVNRLTGTRQAIVHSEPGVTRDRKELICEWNGHRFMLIDTGGVDVGDPRRIARQIIEQARIAVAEADLVLLVVDAAAGISAADVELAQMLRTSRADVEIVANKIDNPRRADEAVEFYELGLGEPLPVSAQHGTNSGDLLDLVVERLLAKDVAFRESPPDSIRVAVLGRPNVGKSTLVNAMLGNDRVIVSDVAGTTRDAIDTRLEFEGRAITLIDTAGIKKSARNKDDVEYYGEVRSLQAADRADVGLLLIDSSQGLREADLSIADEIRKRDCATLVVLSKWDINDLDLADIKADIERKLRQRPAMLTTSGITGRNIQKLLAQAVELYDRYSSRVQTAEFNAALAEIAEKTPPPVDKRLKKRLKFLYGTQYDTAPPRFRINVNDSRLMTRSYGFYVENQIRERFQFEGCPLIIEYRGRSKS